MYDMLYIFGNVLGSTFRIAIKISKFAKIQAFCAKSIEIIKICFQKKVVQNMTCYTFLESPWPCHFKCAKIFANLSNTLGQIKKNCFSMNALQSNVCKKVWKISSQNFCSVLPFYNSFLKSYNKSKSKNQKWF